MQETGDTFSPQAFRAALGQFATGVTIVTATGTDGTPVGMTASSFNSVSIDPPLVLWSVTKSALSAPVFTEAKHYAIHVLSAEQTELSNKFARRGDDKFAQTDYHINENGVPILGGVSARYDCEFWAIYEGGDHWIIVGKVIDFDNSERPALVFGQGAYSLSVSLEGLSTNVRSRKGSKKEITDLFQFQVSQIFHRMVVQFHDVIRSNGITVEQWRIGSSLFGLSSMPLDELKAETHLSEEELRAQLQVMQGDGLADVTDNDDGQMVSLTAKGQQCIQRLMSLAKKQEANILSTLEEDEISDLKLNMQRLIAT